MSEQTDGARRLVTRAQAGLRTVAARARTQWERRAGAGIPEQREADALEVLERRLAHVEAELEGLQDAVHRQAVREHANVEDLRRRLAPERIAKDLSDDARRRGL
jgi:hypothetical protein